MKSNQNDLHMHYQFLPTNAFCHQKFEECIIEQNTVVYNKVYEK